MSVINIMLGRKSVIENIFVLILMFTTWWKSIDSSCPKGKWECLRGKMCITKENVCNGKKDCGDGSDEDSTMCSQWDCTAGRWKCHDGLQCIHEGYVCDGCLDGSTSIRCRQREKDKDKRCNDKSDEDPAMGAQWNCPLGYWKCHDGLQCISKSSRVSYTECYS